MIQYEKLAEALLQSVLEAGAIEMYYYCSSIAVETKQDHSPVTIADREAEAVLVAGLTDAMPDIPIVAEESVAAGKVPEFSKTFFLVDPLDGTREFIHHRNEFTVNVALVDNGVPIFGVVYVPAIGDLYVTFGARRSAYTQISPARRARTRLADLVWQDLRTRQPNPHALTAVASRSHMTPETEAFLARYDVAARRDAGSSLKFCLIARGEADIYPRLAPTMAWDTAAGHAVLLAAGGSVTELNGDPLRYGSGHGEPIKDRLKNPHFVAWGSAAAIPAARIG